MTIRAARPEDAAAIAEIQRSSPEAAQWNVAGYDVQVAEIDDVVVGFLVTRAIVEGEVEILNLAVAPARRRQGIASRLIRNLLASHPAAVFLEVRESNVSARKLYNLLGFFEIGRRANYYEDPLESGVVMKFHSC